MLNKRLLQIVSCFYYVESVAKEKVVFVYGFLFKQLGRFHLDFL